MPRRVLISATDPTTILAFVKPQLDALLDRGWEVVLVSSNGTWKELVQKPGVLAYEIPMKRSISPGPDLRALARWISLLRRLRPDVVVGSTPKAGLLTMIAARVAGVRNRVFLHRGARWESSDGWRRALLVNADRRTCAAATEVLAVSPSLAEVLFAERVVRVRPTVLGAGGSKGVDLTAFHPDGLRNGEAGSFVVGYLGRLTADKGIEVLFAVHQMLQDQGRDVILRIGGELDPSDPVSEATLTRLESRSKSIEWVGNVVDAASFFHGVDVLAFPSYREGLPNVVIEAAACGVPTVGFKVTGVVDAIDDSRSGLLVDQGDVAAMAAAICRIEDEGPGCYRAGAVEWASRFDQKVVTALFVDYLEQLV